MGTSSSSVHPLLLPPGYRFAPTDEELMIFYLRNKVSLKPLPAGAITEIDADELYSKPPHAIVDNPCGETREWYFFIRNKKYEDKEEGKVTTSKKKEDALGLEAKWKYVDIGVDHEENVGKKIRMVGNGIGFWRSVGSDDLENLSAFKIHYIYFEGSISKCKKTHWRMEEFHSVDDHQQDLKKEEWVLGRIKRGRGYCSDY